MPTLEITPTTNISELVAAVPIAREVLEAFGLGCSGCSVNKSETIEQGARAHGLSYSQFMAGLKAARVELDRKVLSDIAIREPEAFASVVETAKAALPARAAG